jgi:hypothetical protein
MVFGYIGFGIGEKVDILTIVLEQLTLMGNSSAVVLEISKVGSSLFKENPETIGDMDYIILCSGFARQKNFVKTAIDGVRYDLMFYDIAEYSSEHEFSPYSVITDRFSVYQNIWAVLREKIYGDSGYEWDLFAHAQAYKDHMTSYLFNCGFNPDRITRVLYGKQFVAAYLTLKFLDQGNTIVTDEILRIVRRLYSCKGRDEECEQIVRWIGQQLGLAYQIK